MDTSPRALVVEDSDIHAYVATTLLQRVGFCVTRAPSLALGIEHASTLLDPAQPLIPTLILLDLMLPHERCPILEGTAGAAWLTEQMETGNLHPAHIVAISSEVTSQREEEAQIAGCDLILRKPFTPVDADAVRVLVDQAPILPMERDRHLPSATVNAHRTLRRLLRREAAELLHFLRSEPAYRVSIGDGAAVLAIVWDVETIRSFLLTPTRLLRGEPWQSWILARGGIDRLRQRLRETPLSSPQLQDVLCQALAHGEDWRTSTEALHCSRAKYYRDLDRVIAELSIILPMW